MGHDEIVAQLRSLGRPERAESERVYLKSALTHYGTAVPDVRRVVRSYLRANPAIDHDGLVAIASALWAAPIHEHRLAAVELLDQRRGLLGPADLDWIEELLRQSRTWALVDQIAGHVVAGLVDRHGELLVALDRWVTDDDFWIRRAAVLALGTALRDGRELDRFFRYADQLLDEREFFIRKVLGWVARELGKRQPGHVSAWLRRNLHRMNGVTIREAVKYLPDGPDILAAWPAAAPTRSR